VGATFRSATRALRRAVERRFVRGRIR
jgi:hypothetical protein